MKPGNFSWDRSRVKLYLANTVGAGVLSGISILVDPPQHSTREVLGGVTAMIVLSWLVSLVVTGLPVRRQQPIAAGPTVVALPEPEEPFLEEKEAAR